MRVLVLTNLYPPAAYGGYELICRDVAAGFAARGHQVAVLTSDHPVVSGGPEGPVAVERTLPFTWEHGAAPPVWRRPIIERRAVRTLAAALDRIGAEVVSVWNPSGLPGALLGTLAALDRPVVWVLGDAWPERAVRGDPWLAPFAHRPALGRAVAALTGLPTRLPEIGAGGTVCCASRDLRDRVGAAMGWSMAGTVVAPHGVDLVDFPLDPPRPEAGWGWRLLYVGRLDPTKGIDTLLRAMASLPAAATLRIAAPDEPVHVTRVRALIRTLGLEGRVTLAGAPRRELSAIYRTADVCVFPSEWPEPFGLVPLEAMASGTPVVATGTGGSGEYLTDRRNCLLFPPGDPAALAAALRTLSGDPALRERLVAEGRSTAGRLTVDRLVDELEEIHRRAVASGRR